MPEGTRFSPNAPFGLRLAGAVLTSGTALVLCLPLGEHGTLAWFALLPLALATRGRGFLVGFLGGMATVLFAAWLSTTGLLYTHPRSGSSNAWVYTGFGIFGASFATTFAFWGDRWTEKYPAWWFAALATLMEAVLLLKLPAHLALSQYRNAPMVQLASVGGVWMVSFLVWWSNFALASKQRIGWILAAVAAITVFGGAWLPREGEVRRFAAVQIAESEEAALRKAQAEATKAGASLVVWPEFGGLMLAPKGDTKTLRAIGGAPFVTSFRDDAAPLPHNVAALFADVRESVRYAKRKLFGDETKMHTAGSKAVAVGDVGLNVCFDSCFPSVVRETAALGTAVIALPTIDPPSTNDFVAAIHAAYSPFRAAESGVAIVRADGYAYSNIVDARGKIVGEAPHGDRVLVASAVVGPRWTPTRTLGDWFLWVCGGLVVYRVVPKKWYSGRDSNPRPSP